MTGSNPPSLDHISMLAEHQGLQILGHKDGAPESGLNHGLPPFGEMILIGNAGPALWREFSTSPEFRDENPDSLDRWTRRVGLEIADRQDCAVVFPFDGPPYAPFISWAEQASEASISPLLMLIHPEFGLWHAYRFALLLDYAVTGAQGEVLSIEKPRSPCMDCNEKPCLTACPVGAISNGAYDRAVCVAYLVDEPGSQCRQTGCMARRACPVGPEFRYEPGQAEFHMNAFVLSQTNDLPES